MSTIKEKVSDAAHAVADKASGAAHAVADKAKDVGHKIADGATQAADFVKEKTGLGAGNDMGVKERMEVFASCGRRVGVVDHVNDGVIKLTRKDSPDGQHHFIPVSWVEKVDTHVHLKKTGTETEQNWKSDAAACGCG